jgi:alkanesulfonate monooxygenase SsuD/methylene tetrahydromethanopterin reductase-like flavin-dependent oxidoreductase (luciferase family)
MTAYSVLVPFVPSRPEQLLPFAALVQWTEAERLWQGQSMLLDTAQAYSYVAGAGFRVPVGVGVTLMPLRHPYEAALEARSLALVTGQPVVAGFGPGSASFQESLLGTAYPRPVTEAGDYLVAVRNTLSGTTGPSGISGATPGGAVLPPLVGPRVHLGLGVLRRRMAEVAGQVADAAITWLTPPAYLRDVVVPTLRESAEASGRTVPRLTAMVPVALSAPDRDLTVVAQASNRPHLQQSHYVAMLRRAGGSFGGTGSLADAEALIRIRAFVGGNPSQINEQLQEYVEAGVDEIVLNLTGVARTSGLQRALAELKQLIPELCRTRRVPATVG